MFGTLRSLFKTLISVFYRIIDTFFLINKLRNLNSGDWYISPRPLYYSQYANDNNWKEEGWNNQKECRYWSPRICAIACIKMFLFAGGITPSLSQLTKEGYSLNGYDTKRDMGWYHDPLVGLLTKYGCKAKVVKRLGVSRIFNELTLHHAVIASVDARRLNSLLKYNKNVSKIDLLKPSINHMILVVGYRLEEGRCKGLYFFNPSYPAKNTNQPFFLKGNNFVSLFNHRGMVVWR